MRFLSVAGTSDRKMQAAPPLLSFLLILLHHSGWIHGLCKLENNTVAWCDKLEDLGQIETYHLETLTAPTGQDTLVPGLFNNLTNLRHLDMSGGDLKTIESGSFRALSNLRNLDLSDNRIEYLELASLEGLINLRKLNLRKNAIRQLPPALVRLKHLRQLDIYDNPLDCNCATLKIRDLIMQRKVFVSKKAVCADPGNLRGMSLMKPSAAIICSFREEQDREMQNDQAIEGSGIYSGSGDDVLNEFNSEEEEEEYSAGTNGSSEKPEVETPFPTGKIDSIGSSVSESTISSQESTAPVEEITITTTNSLQSTEDEEIFFDNEEKKEQMSTTEMSRKKEDFKDALFYPSTGSGDGDEDSSGEGSGSIWTHYDEEKVEKDTTKEESSSYGTIWDLLFGSSTATTAIPSETKDPDLEQEQFIDASSTKLTTEESSKRPPVDETSSETIAIASGVEEVSKSADKSKSGNVKAEVNSLNDEQDEVSPAKQSKKGMGSYIVLAILLAVVAVLIGFAAYRGDICRKKRKRGDVENGTELRDMQKSLLPDTGNSTQPKIASNGNSENVPLVEGTSDGDNAKIDKIQSDHHPIQETPRSFNGTADHLDPVKPPRKLANSQDDQKSEDRPRVDINSLRENFLAGRTSPAQPSDSSLTTNNGPRTEPNGPPLSPGAQRVKITLQENPDSVPKTPILITRTMAGENLVKTP